MESARGCNILAEGFSRKDAKGAKEDYESPLRPLRLCVKRPGLFITHGGGHGGDDRVRDSSLMEFVNFGWRQIEIHW
jgi:hypothetical protein